MPPKNSPRETDASAETKPTLPAVGTPVFPYDADQFSFHDEWLMLGEFEAPDGKSDQPVVLTGYLDELFGGSEELLDILSDNPDYETLTRILGGHTDGGGYQKYDNPQQFLDSQEGSKECLLVVLEILEEEIAATRARLGLDNAPVKGRELAPEVQEKLLAALEARFAANKKRHEGIEWADVKRSLEAAPEKLWSLQQMEEAGHAPDVYMEDDESYHFGTCSKETTESVRSIVYDAEAERTLMKSRQENCNGNAVDIAASMGIDLMNEEQYRHLHALEGFDIVTSSWIKAPDRIRALGSAPYGSRVIGFVFMAREDVRTLNDDRGFRGSLKVLKV
jgi:hypothetical protein